MIPIRLELENFLSYRAPAVLGFHSFQLACVAGENGAGKSSLLDAITWSLFGKCRAPGRDDVVNRRAVRQGEAARVQLDFQLEKETYRVLRVQKPGQTGLLEFQVAVGDGEWKPLTEATQTQTQARLEELLRMNYETFTNASFLLQGRADEFTIKRPGERKRILGDLLGVSHWERYREESAGRRRELEKELASLDGRLAEIESERAKRPEREKQLVAARESHRVAREQRGTQDELVQGIKAYEGAVAQQRSLVDTLRSNLVHGQGTLKQLERTLSSRQVERDELQRVLDRADDIEGQYDEWRAAAAELTEWDGKAHAWNELKAEQQRVQLVIEREKSRLVQARSELERRRGEAANRAEQRDRLRERLEELEPRIEALQETLAEVEPCRQLVGELQSEIGAIRGQQPHLRSEMREMKARQVQLQSEETGRCPLCDQELTLEHRAAVIAQIEGEGQTLGDRYRANEARLDQLQSELAQVEGRLRELGKTESELRAAEREETALQAQLAEIERTLTEWERDGVPKLAQVEQQLSRGEISPPEQRRAAELDDALAELGYAAESHAASRRRVEELAGAQDSHQELGEARAALRPLEATLSDLTQQIKEQSAQVARLSEQLASAETALSELGPAPETSLAAAERRLNQLREEEVLASKAVGAAEEALRALDYLQEQQVRLSDERKEMAQRIRRLQTLERAFGRNGVQALLIEQALPAIQDNANELLDRLTGGEMRVSFSTQRQLKSRDALAETLDIHIRDSAGERPYEMYSGGEAFRVNFAIRIALSRLLAQRAGARLQTLVIDEGFGSQDPEGRQRLIEAINTIRMDFAKVLVITHIDELKDAFPVRIEVTKGTEGSQVQLN